MILRQFFCDWEAERLARMPIERLDATYGPRPLDLAFIEQRRLLVERWFTTLTSVATLQRVALSEFDAALPTSTVRVSPTERVTSLRRRSIAAEVRQWP